MIERVALAMWARHACIAPQYIDGRWLALADENTHSEAEGMEGHTFFGRNHFRDAARAAIEAMIEPTEAMLMAVWPLYHPWGENAPKPEDRPNQVEDMRKTVAAEWQAMIRSSLSPENRKP